MDSSDINIPGTRNNKVSDMYISYCNVRKYLRAKVTRIHNKINLNHDNLTLQVKTDYINQLKNLGNELNVANMNVHSVMPEDVNVDDVIDCEEEYSEKITSSLDILEPVIVPPINDSGPIPSSSAIMSNANKLKLPVIELPVFSNDSSDNLEKFFYAFESIVNKHNLSNYEKFIYLKGQVRKGPEALLNSLDPVEQTYESAKKLLMEAFASPLTQKYNVIKKLASLKLNFNDDIYEFIGNLRSIMSSFKNLDIDSETIIQYFMWTSFNKRFQDQMIQITNCTKPSLSQMWENIFSASERYIKLSEQINERNNKKSFHSAKPNFSQGSESMVTNNLAINVKPKTVRFCDLCRKDGVQNIEHVLRNCPVYTTPSDKIAKLSSYNYCSKCSFINHHSDNCKFKFKDSCRVCGKHDHMSYLCPKSGGVGTVTSNVACVHFSSVVASDNVLLPTFSVEISKNGVVTNSRVLHDTGSQRNFVHERVANLLNLDVLEYNVDLQIHGFNTEKCIKTKIVNVPMFVNNAYFSVDAIVVPNININLCASNLNVIANKFREKGYLLADRMLGDSASSVSGFDMVMGPDSVKMLCPRTVVFGKGPKSSVFLQTENGVLLLGETKNLIENLKYLPPYIYQNSAIIADTNLNVHVNSSMVNQVLNEAGEIISNNLKKATEEALEAYSNHYFNYDSFNEAENNEVNDKVVEYVLNNAERTPEGRLILPLPWHPECKHLLGKNFNLSRKILQSNFSKLVKDDKLTLYDNVFKEQEKLGIIERIEDVDSFMKFHPECSFLPHMGIYKMDKETTKVRIVYLSNLCEKGKLNPNAVSHNNALLPGPSLNTKLSTSLLLARFDKYVLCFDIVKAFLGIQLREEDQNKLLCLWYKSVPTGDFSLIAYRNLRLSFGLRPSPAILMLALYKMLIVDVEDDDRETIHLKKMIYNNIYMDNGIVSCNDKLTLFNYYRKLPLIFGEYMFSLQQYCSNDFELQSKIDGDHGVVTDTSLKYFGMNWNRESDTLGPFSILLDLNADSKRSILASLNAVYDIFNVSAPLLNRAKLFFQNLQCNCSLDWDAKLSPELLREWRNICKQTNSYPPLKVNRFVGTRDSTYTLVAFSDSSAAIYGVVVYIIENETNKISFVLAKNKVVNTKLSKKSIPSLECQGVVYAAEIIIELFSELCSDKTISPINITNLFVYTDSMVCLAWIRSYFLNYDKMQKRSIFVLNRLKRVGDVCNTHPIVFRFVEGRENTADCVTRPMSYNTLSKTCYLSGPLFLKTLSSQPEFEVRVPNPISDIKARVTKGEQPHYSMALTVENSQGDREVVCEYLVDPSRFSSFQKIVKIHTYVLKFINELKIRIKKNGNDEVSVFPQGTNLNSLAANVLIRTDQEIYFPDVVQFFKKRNITCNKIPNLVLQLNLFVDEQSIIRVKGKFKKGDYPALLSNKSRVAELIIIDLHKMFAHSGVYCVLRELRKKFWILKGFSTVRKLLRNCVTCKKVNENPLKLSQNSYREFRSNPPKIPFSYVFIDYIGPINIKLDGNVRKSWLLIITCLWSRAVSLQICHSADTSDFLHGVQCHIYKHGLFQLCLSDLGSQIISGGNVIADFLNDINCTEYFKAHGVEKVTFEQYAKGNSSLGSLVEVLVKQTKSLIKKSIGKLILDYRDFYLLIAKTNHIINRRPISFQQTLRETSTVTDMPDPITPEQLIYGRELLSVSVIPSLQPEVDGDASFNPGPGKLKDEYHKLRSAMERLCNLYHSEFLTQLMSQAIDRRDRYKPVNHKLLCPGDVVLLVEPQTKRSNYPMGRIQEVKVNSLGEVTSAVVLKGKNRERVWRHATTIIPILSLQGESEDTLHKEQILQSGDPAFRRQSPRTASNEARKRIASQYDDDLI